MFQCTGVECREGDEAIISLLSTLHHRLGNNKYFVTVINIDEPPHFVSPTRKLTYLIITSTPLPQRRPRIEGKKGITPVQTKPPTGKAIREMP